VERWSGKRQVVSLIGSEAAPNGAALYAQMQIDQPGPNLDFHVREVTSHYLGVRGFHRKSGRRRTSLIVARNTRLPATSKSTFRTLQDGQTSLLLEIVEGTDDAAEGHLIGSCRLENLPPGQPAGTPIEIEFHVAENGRVSVFVESLATGRRSSPQIQRHGGMTAEERTQWRDWLDTGLLSGQFA
jgi:molecular chaperone DnaK